MAKKRQTPRPPRPVQGPKRRDGTRPKPAAHLGRPLWIWAAGGIGLVAVAGVLASILSTGGGAAPLPLTPASSLGSLRAAPAPGPIGPEGVPIPAAPPLAPAGWLTLGQSRDGINCQPIEQLAYHIHVHLTVFIDGKARLIPYGIGIAPPRLGTTTQNGYFVTGGSCFAWLHTHASDGIIHIESPSAKTYTLGDFFDIWGQPLGTNEVGSARGRVTAFFNGQHYTGNPRQMPLLKHAQIQLDIGTPLIAPEKITFPDGL